MADVAVMENVKSITNNGGTFDAPDFRLQELQEKARAAQEAFEREEKMRKELEVLNSKLLSEKTDLLSQLAGEAGSLQEYQEKSIKLAAQKMDLESQLSVRKNSKIKSFIFFVVSLTKTSSPRYRSCMA